MVRLQSENEAISFALFLNLWSWRQSSHSGAKFGRRRSPLGS